MNNIDEEIRRIFAEVVCCMPHEIYNDSTFNSLVLDSMDEVEVLVGIEHHFQISIEDHEFFKCKNVKEVIDLVHKLLK